MSVNVENVLLMLNVKDMGVDYISPNIDKLVSIPEKNIHENIRALDCLVEGDSTLRVLDKLRSLTESMFI